MADVRLASAIKHRRSEWHAFAETVRKVEESVVVQLGDGFPHRGGPESLFEPFAHGFDARLVIQHLSNTRAKFLGSPAKMRFENLADIHTRRNAQGIQHDIYRRTVRHVGHVFLRDDPGDHALVAVTSRHFVAY